MSCFFLEFLIMGIMIVMVSILIFIIITLSQEPKFEYKEVIFSADFENRPILKPIFEFEKNNFFFLTNDKK